MKINQKLSSLFNNTKESDLPELIRIIKIAGIKDDSIERLINNKASKNLDVYAIKKENDFLDRIYKDDINKINHILNTNTIIKKLDGVKILVYGETGTGKTTLINKIIQMNKMKFDYKKINFESMLSYRFGQSQINMINLLHEINDEAKEKPLIIFIDEIDSIISSRNISNDIGEHARVIATFLKFLDGLSENIIFIGATNIINKIDDSVKRRFNIRMEGKSINIFEFVTMIKQVLNLTSTRKFSNIKEVNANVKFKISDLNEFENAYVIEKSINQKIDPLSIFIKLFKDRLVLEEALNSRRAKEAARKAGISE